TPEAKKQLIKEYRKREDTDKGRQEVQVAVTLDKQHWEEKYSPEAGLAGNKAMDQPKKATIVKSFDCMRVPFYRYDLGDDFTVEQKTNEEVVFDMVKKDIKYISWKADETLKKRAVIWAIYQELAKNKTSEKKVSFEMTI
ncbi:MAG: hypothetical protein JW841_18430, partial [Deltaproteobacteria bacterium]|nr:hypothetical protein [Deltaproteobacteria bacterium]